jgi:signal transduction histidine kinase
MLLDWLVRTVSFFNTILLLWLGLMVILTGNRKSVGTWIVSGGLFVGTLFFISHTMIMGGNIARLSLGVNFWWTVSWIPAVAAPIAWYGSMLWYAGFRWDQPHPHKKFLVLIFLLMLLMGFQVVLWNPLPSYQEMMFRLLPAIGPSFGGLPLIVFTYLVLSVLCYLLPLDLIGQDLFGDKPLAAAAFRKARPWLMMASIALLLASLVMIWTALWILETIPTPSLKNQGDLLQVKRLDLIVASLVGLAIILLGRAVVAYEVFTGRPLPRNRFSRQWRSTVILAGGYSSVIAFGVTIQLPMLYIVMSATVLFTLFYGLYSWRSYSQRDALIARVRPLLSSGELFSQVTKPDRIAESGPYPFFCSLCQTILSVPVAVIIPVPWVAPLIHAPLVFNPFGKPFDYTLPGAPDDLFFPDGPTLLPGENEGVAWMVSLWRESELIGILLLGEKADGNPFTEEEIEVAQLGGERLLDMMAGTEMARMAIALLRERVSEMALMESRSRRILHDEVLPEIHTAILKLQSGVNKAGQEDIVLALSDTHRILSDLIRDRPPTVPERLAKGGLVQAVKELLRLEYDRNFQAVHWNVSKDFEERVQRLPEVSREVIFFAVRELLRNAVKHAAGGDVHREVCLWLSCYSSDDDLVIQVRDDGIGISEEAHREFPGGNGLRFHAAMLAVIGGRLSMHSPETGGTRAAICVKAPPPQGLS